METSTLNFPVFNYIKKFHNILDSQEFYECSELLKRPKWERTTTNPEIGECLLWRMNLMSDDFFRVRIFSKIENLLEKKLSIVDLYANGSTTSMGSFPHIDAIENNVMVFLLYVNSDWKVEWGGQTVFLNRFFDCTKKVEIGNNETISFYPNPNSALYFPGNIVHMSEPPTREFRGLRQTVAFRVKEL